jgi:hypothetical protein
VESTVAAADVASIEGVDGLIIGQYGLSPDLGCTLYFSQMFYAESVTRSNRPHYKWEYTFWRGTRFLVIPVGAPVARGHRILMIDDDRLLTHAVLDTDLAKAEAQL